jgi:F0F1-type ATP synthase membrane subunit c/vacuolar-type H+-ATPase subunit K
MIDHFTIIVIFMGILSVLGIIGIIISPFLKDKEQPET